MPESPARISEKYAAIPKKFCEESQSKESRSEANKASASLNLKTGSNKTQKFSPNFGLRNLAKIAVKTRSSAYFSPKIYAPQVYARVYAPRVYALGGINSENIKSVRKLAIHGFAAIDLFKQNS